MNTDSKDSKIIDSEQIKQIKIRRLQKRLLKYTAAIILVLTAIWLVGSYNMAVYGNAVPIGKVQGNSMEPTYHHGQWITYYTPDKRPVENGSIIIYSTALTKSLVVHRVVYINPDGSMVTKGDHWDVTDQEVGFNSRNVTMSDVYGVVGGPLFGE